MTTPQRAEAEADAGIDARRAGVLNADAVVGPDLDWTAPRVHRELFDVQANLGQLLTHAIVNVLETSDRDQPAPRAALDKLGVSALDGLFAQLCVNAVSGANDDALWDLLRTTQQLGSGQTSLDLRSDRTDLDRAAIPIFAASEVTPTIAIHLDGCFTERTADQRRDVLDLCLSLAEGCRVHLVVSGLVGTFLWKYHRDQLPTSVTEQFDPRVSPTPGTPQSVADRATAARRQLDPDGTATRVLRAIRAETAEMLSYDALSDELSLSPNNRRQVALKLDREFELAERVDMPGGDRGLSLRPAGSAYLDAVDSETGRQQRFSALDSGGVIRPPNPSEYSRVSPHAREETTEDGPHDQPPTSECDRPTAEGEAVTSTVEYVPKRIQPVYLDTPSSVATRTAAESGEIALVDASTKKLKGRDGERDERVMGWSYDDTTKELTISATFVNPCQYTTCIARALASAWTWRDILTEDVLKEIFAEHSRRILSDARNIGGLTDERYADPELFIEFYKQQEQRLCDLTGELAYGEYEDESAKRSEITQFAKGLAGSLVQLLELAGIELSREVRLPNFSDNWCARKRRRMLCRTLAHSCAIESLYGHHVTYRHLYESRDDRRNAAMEPEVDARDPLGELVGSLVIVGPGVSDVEDELCRALGAPAELHEDAPEIAVRIPVQTTTSRSVIAQTVRQMCERKHLEPTREAISLFDGFVGTSYDVARALHRGLEAEDTDREIRVDEVRRALAHLGPERLLPTTGVNPSMQKALSVLLGARTPLSGVEVARRAGITDQSFRDNRKGFVIAGVLRETPEGWRVALSFADEQYGKRDILPWFVAEEPEEFPYIGSVELRRWSDVVFELAEVVGVDPGRFGDPEDVLCWAFMPPKGGGSGSDRGALVEHRRSAREALCREWPWLRPVLSIIDAACETPAAVSDPPARTGAVLMGPRLSQRPLAVGDTGDSAVSVSRGLSS
jgi:hypothetical protein